MAQVNIQGVGAVNFPDDYSPERIKFAIENDILPRVKKTAREPDAIEKSALDAMKPSKLERLGRGFADVTQGLKQGALAVKDAVTGSDDATAYTAAKTDEVKRYEAGRGPNAGFDLMRLGGNVLATAPASLIPGAGAAALATRVGVGAAQGAVASASMFTPEGESKLEQTLLGAGFGGAAPAVFEGGRRALANLTRQMSAGQTVLIPQIQQELTIQLKAQGLDFNKLTGDVQRSLLEDAQKALKSGGTLDPTQLARKADIEAVGAKGTQAAVSREPKDWQTQQNLRGITNVGEGIGKRQADDATAMVDYLGRLRSKTGGKATTALEAGEAPIKALKAQDEAAEGAVGKLYDAFRASGAVDAKVPDTKIADAMGRVADEIGVENIPAAVLARLKEFGFAGGRRAKLLTVNEADKLNRLINNNNPGHGPQSLALGRLKGALNEALLEVDAGAKQGADALITARAAAAERFAEQRAGKGITAAIDDVAPDRFVKRFVIDADTRDLRAMLDKLKKTPDGTQAIADVKGHLFDNLLMKATGATSADDVAGRPFSGRNFAKALDSIAPEKLHQIFTPDELNSLRTLQRASKYLTEEVPFSDVNHSKTAAALANLLQKIGSTPMLGSIVSPIIGAGKIGADWVKSSKDRKMVAEMLITTAAQEGIKSALPPPGNLSRLAPAGAASAFARVGDERN